MSHTQEYKIYINSFYKLPQNSLMKGATMYNWLLLWNLNYSTKENNCLKSWSLWTSPNAHKKKFQILNNLSSDTTYHQKNSLVRFSILVDKSNGTLRIDQSTYLDNYHQWNTTGRKDKLTHAELILTVSARKKLSMWSSLLWDSTSEMWQYPHGHRAPYCKLATMSLPTSRYLQIVHRSWNKISKS